MHSYAVFWLFHGPESLQAKVPPCCFLQAGPSTIASVGLQPVVGSGGDETQPPDLVDIVPLGPSHVWKLS